MTSEEQQTDTPSDKLNLEDEVVINPSTDDKEPDFTIDSLLLDAYKQDTQEEKVDPVKQKEQDEGVSSWVEEVLAEVTLPELDADKIMTSLAEGNPKDLFEYQQNVNKAFGESILRAVVGLIPTIKSSIEDSLKDSLGNLMTKQDSWSTLKELAGLPDNKLKEILLPVWERALAKSKTQEAAYDGIKPMITMLKPQDKTTDDAKPVTQSKRFADFLKT